ncbi:MAG TPA: peptidylprolyl isomerase [Mycobacteriales bacterium]|nr:peptidylprolyl isomerase [Mycobacteriales bacterium]
MTRTSRRPTLVLSVGLALALVAGCGDSPARSGAAATVGDERITTEELQSIVDRGLTDPQAQEQFGADRADYQRQVLNRMVRALLLEEAAEQEGVEVTQGDVDEQIEQFAEQAGGREELEAQAAAGGIAPEDLPRFAREVVLEISLGDALTEDLDVPQAELEAVYEQSIGQYQQVRSRHILLEEEQQARDVLAQVQADPAAFERLAAELSTDTSNAEQGGDLGFQPRGTFVPEFDEAVFTEPEGEPFVVQTQFGWHVVEVVERRTTSLEEATPELERRALAEQRTERVDELLRETAERVGVEVNPRFGQWDGEAVEVAPSPDDDGLSSPEPEEPAIGGQPGAPQGGDPGAPQGGDPGQAPEGVQPEAPVESPAS